MNRKGKIVVNIILSLITMMCIGTFIANLFICHSTLLLIVNETAIALIVYSLLATLKEQMNKV